MRQRDSEATHLYHSRQDATAKIAQCEQWYAERNLPTVLRLNQHTAPAALDRLLDMRGYRLEDPSLTLHRHLSSCTMPGDLHGAMRSEPLPDWLLSTAGSAGRPLPRIP